MVAVIEQLTEPQRECLRLVLRHHNSKEIAASLGVSPSAVDKRIERAVQLLGVTSRFAAARLLAQHETDTSERIAWQPTDVHPGAVQSQSEQAERPATLLRRLLGFDPGDRKPGWARVRLLPLQRLSILMAMILFIAITSLVLVDLGTTLTALIEVHWPAHPARTSLQRSALTRG